MTTTQRITSKIFQKYQENDEILLDTCFSQKKCYIIQLDNPQSASILNAVIF